MGREIRRVPKDWQHPKNRDGHFVPLYDDDYDSACREWWTKALAWHSDENADEAKEENPWYWDWDSPPPNKEWYRAPFDAEPVAYQIYETVSEGTPVSPVFASVEAMIEWMSSPIDRRSEWNKNMADWQSMQGMTPEQASTFCNAGSSFSMMIVPGQGIKAGHKL